MDVYLDYARRGQNAWWRYLLTLVLAVVIWLVMDVLLFLGLSLSHLAAPELAADLATPTHPVIFFIGTGVLFALLVAALVIAARLLQHKRFIDVIGQWRWERFAAGVGIWAICLIASTLVDLVARPAGFRWTATGETGAVAVAVLFGLGAQTFAEEFIFRGYLTQGLLLATRRPWAAAILSGMMFGALHIPNGVPQCLNAIVFGVIASWIAIRTGGIAFTYGLHLINNLFLAVIVVSADDVLKGSPGLFTYSAPSLVWLDTGIGVVIQIVPALLVFWWLRDRGPARAEVTA
jgi:membrane protease YdiL (CAAX protease family)